MPKLKFFPHLQFFLSGFFAGGLCARRAADQTDKSSSDPRGGIRSPLGRGGRGISPSSVPAGPGPPGLVALCARMGWIAAVSVGRTWAAEENADRELVLNMRRIINRMY